MAFERLPAEVIQRFLRLEDLTGAASDAMDALGLAGAVPATVLRPSLPQARVAGQAVTVRSVERADTPLAAATAGKGRMGEQEAYNLADRGDVVVIEGLTGVSNLGGLSATLAHRSGCAGAIVDGSHRDPEASRSLGFPIWSRGVTPITGKWRLETVEINGCVRVGGVSVQAGDLVLADEAGVVFVPRAQVLAVIEKAEQIHVGDARQRQDIADGVGLAELAATRYK